MGATQTQEIIPERIKKRTQELQGKNPLFFLEEASERIKKKYGTLQFENTILMVAAHDCMESDRQKAIVLLRKAAQIDKICKSYQTLWATLDITVKRLQEAEVIETLHVDLQIVAKITKNAGFSLPESTIDRTSCLEHAFETVSEALSLSGEDILDSDLEIPSDEELIKKLSNWKAPPPPPPPQEETRLEKKSPDTQ